MIEVVVGEILSDRILRTGRDGIVNAEVAPR